MKKSYRLPVIALAALLLSLSAYYLFHYLDTMNKTLLIGGSSTVYQYTKALAESYTQGKRDVRIINESGGSTPGLIAVKNGSIDIASMSRDLEDSEDDEFTKNYLIGKDAVGIIVHPSNSVADLTTKQIEELFSGAIDNWSKVGGKEGPVRVVTRTPESTTFKGLNEIVLKGVRVAGSASIAESSQEMAETVANDPDAIGFLALKDIQSNVKAVKVNNVPITRETILTDRYPITRSFYYVVYDMPDKDPAAKQSYSFLRRIASLVKTDDETARGRRTDAIRDFIDFARSSQGQEIIKREGAVSVY